MKLKKLYQTITELPIYEIFLYSFLVISVIGAITVSLQPFEPKEYIIALNQSLPVHVSSGMIKEIEYRGIENYKFKLTNKFQETPYIYPIDSGLIYFGEYRLKVISLDENQIIIKPIQW